VLLERAPDSLRTTFKSKLIYVVYTSYPAFLEYMHAAHGTEYDRIKDIPYDGPEQQLSGLTLRDLLKTTAMHMRAINPNVWADYVAEEIVVDDGFSIHGPAGRVRDVIVADYRFPNERTVMAPLGRVYTTRVFRGDVDIPPSDAIAEHNLDQEATDFLVLPCDDEAKHMAKFSQLFSFSDQYVKVGTVTTNDA
jgi:hypothetical protein